MREVDRLRAEVEGTIAGDPWYGSPIVRILDGVDATAASSHSIPDAHSIWELVLHMTAWTKETTRRLRGGPHGTPAEGDWPPVTATDSSAWNASVADLRRAHGELARTLAEFDDAHLGRQVGGAQVDAQGRAVTLYQTVVGLLQHDAYHAGQVAMLKKLLVTGSDQPNAAMRGQS